MKVQTKTVENDVINNFYFKKQGQIMSLVDRAKNKVKEGELDESHKLLGLAKQSFFELSKSFGEKIHEKYLNGLCSYILNGYGLLKKEAIKQ